MQITARYDNYQKIVPHLPTSGSPRSVESLCITWCHPWVLSLHCPQEQLPQRLHGHQDPCACATYGKLADVMIFLFRSIKWRLRLRRPDLMLYSYRSLRLWSTRIVWRFGEMPEFPLLKSQSGQVEWNGGRFSEAVENLQEIFQNFTLKICMRCIHCTYPDQKKVEGETCHTSLQRTMWYSMWIECCFYTVLYELQRKNCTA
jgi:hypothetical protein